MTHAWNWKINCCVKCGMRLNYNQILWVSMGASFLASAIYSWLFVILFDLEELILSSALNFSLLLPLTWVFSQAGAVMSLAGFSKSQSLFVVLALSQAGIFVGLLLGLWTASAF